MPTTNSEAPDALCCTLQFTLGAGNQSTPGIAIMVPTGDFTACAHAAEQAAQLAVQSYGGSVFQFWTKLRDALESWCTYNDRDPAAARFGLALVERAVLDAFCRAREVSLANAVRENLLGVDLGALCKPLAGRHPKDLLDPPLAGDPALRVLIAPDDSLDAITPDVGHISIGLTGNTDADVARFRAIAEHIGKLERRVEISLEGNGAYTDPREVRELIDQLLEDESTRNAARGIAFVEQPFPVEASLTNTAVAVFAEWPNRPAVII
ncbi:MAG: hypothetical protein ACQKBV_04105, partial [Puniceicoccales bacterium]